MTRPNASAHRVLRSAAGALALNTLACCGGAAELAGQGPAYTRSSALLRSGYSETAIDDSHYQVRATGVASAPAAQIEKLALTRAAEIGVESKFRYFKVTNIRQAVECGRKQDVYKGATQAAFYLRTVSLDVAYAKGNAPPDAAYLNADDSYARYAAALKTETAAPETAAAAMAEAKAQCGAR